MIKKLPLISLVIPVFNSEEFLEKNISSVINQTYNNIEVIYVDDGSTDKSKGIIEKFSTVDSRISLISQENKYAGAARNTGMDAAKGVYIIFLDADDFFDHRMIEKLYGSIDRHNADIAVCGASSFDHLTKEITKRPWILKKSLIPKSGFLSRETIKQNIFSFTTPVTWNKLFKRKFILDNRIRFQEISRSNDMAFVFAAIAIASRIAIHDEALVFYRVNNKYSLQASKDKDVYAFYEALLGLKSNLEKSGLLQELKEPFCDFAIESCRHNLTTLKDRKKFVELFYFIRHKVFKEFRLNERSLNFCDGFSKTNEKFANSIVDASIENFISEFNLNQFS